MNYLLFHNSTEGQFPKVPDGLKELMSDISREVLREQPENIYEFIADYLEEMEITREHKGISENVLDMVIDESITVHELFEESGITLEQARKSAQIMEKSFHEFAKNKKMKYGDQKTAENTTEKLLEKDICRKIMKSCDLTREQDQKLRKIVQMCFKSFYFREKTYRLKLSRLPDSHWANRAERTLDIYRRSLPRKSQLDRAAVVIQSAYRSYFVRKMPKEIQKFHECATKIQTRFRAYIAEKKFREEKAAAIKIQAMFRGYKARKFVCSQRDLQKMDRNAPLLLASDVVADIVTMSMMEKNIRRAVSSTKSDKSELKVTFDSSSKADMAARAIQKVYRGFQARKKAAINDSNSLRQRIAQTEHDNVTIQQQIEEIILSIPNAINSEQEEPMS
ncbi:Abnormal spindle-like microcephaly-associated protein like [Pseudolycoriella hygida]|uniref:Abnormal spindle-like microcephaly-associated protein like n=1 Tax=Pseudolycoriella hygida TaxID=35572 RepID=A0A9Q0MQE6_9DIPT|nr:Abnormal spindle-like microcephaly-associated protein like [Pseudolycoriella hygida]